MTPSQTPNFQFSREGKFITCWFSGNPQKTNEGKEQYLSFKRECNSELEAILLHDYLQDFQHLIIKEYFTQGYEAKKKREQNWYL